MTIQAFTQCSGLIYVTTMGNGSGSKADPSSLTNALSIAQSGNIIKIATGNYTIATALNIAPPAVF